MFPMVSSHHRPHLVAEGPVALCMLGRGTSSGKSIRTVLPNGMECVMRQPTFPLLFAKGQLWDALVSHDKKGILKRSPSFVDVIF